MGGFSLESSCCLLGVHERDASVEYPLITGWRSILGEARSFVSARNELARKNVVTVTVSP